MRITLIACSVLLSACTTNQPEANVIVADGTEMEQFERLLLCGDAEGFTKALGDVGVRLSNAWDEIEGQNSSYDCTVRIDIDSAGNITDHEVVACDKPMAIPQVLATASPVPLPDNPCLVKSIKSSKFALNSTDDNE